MAAEPLTLAVREHAAWCDLVCRLHRLTPQGDARLWWSARRTPDLVPDAVTLVPDVPVLDALGRITDSPGATVEDSFAALDLSHQGWTVLTDATWMARPPGPLPDGAVASTFAVVREKFHFAAWCRAWGGPAGALPIGVRRAPGVTVLGRDGGAGLADGGILHHTAIGGTAVVGLWHGFGEWADVAAAASQRHPGAWLVSQRRGADVAVALDAGFAAVGPVRIWHRDPDATPRGPE
jgi:hypothetical protein